MQFAMARRMESVRRAFRSGLDVVTHLVGADAAQERGSDQLGFLRAR